MAHVMAQFIRFAIVGGVATVIHVTAAIVLKEVSQVDLLVSNGVAFCLAASFSYLANHRWTFKAASRHAIHLLRFLAVASLGLTLNQVIMFVLVEGNDQHYLVALAIVATLVPLVTFMANRCWTFGGATSRHLDIRSEA